MDFKAPLELWNPLSKAVCDKFHRSGGHGKCNCLPDRNNFHRSRAWQVIVLIFDTALCQIHIQVNMQYCGNILSYLGSVMSYYTFTIHSRVIQEKVYIWNDIDVFTQNYKNTFWYKIQMIEIHAHTKHHYQHHLQTQWWGWLKTVSRLLKVFKDMLSMP